ncbi:MAG: hypothetical protein R3279_11385, partial [Putridiphycobacter sp.]|nr:hypothetical protein [Putridiphycobacter sp.]
LKISRNIRKAIQQINNFKVATIDTGICNNKPFIGVCGFGFDAHIAKKFEHYHRRGLRSYAKLVTSSFNNYKPPFFTITANQFSIKQEALLACISNSSEYGNGFAISPHSEMQDGQFELILIEKFSLWSVPIMLSRFFTKNIDRSKHHTAIQFSDSIQLKVDDSLPVSYHLDGEHLESHTSEFKISVKPKSLKVLI